MKVLHRYIEFISIVHTYKPTVLSNKRMNFYHNVKFVRIGSHVSIFEAFLRTQYKSEGRMVDVDVFTRIPMANETLLPCPICLTNTNMLHIGHN